MEIAIGLGCVILLMIILGVPIQPIIGVAIGFIMLLALLCVAFFLVMVLILFFTKKKKANFLRFEPGEKFGAFAVYEIDGAEYRNTFPTDTFTEKWFYKEGETSVMFRQTKRRLYVFDKLTLVIIGIGLPAFALIAFVGYLGLTL